MIPLDSDIFTSFVLFNITLIKFKNLLFLYLTEMEKRNMIFMFVAVFLLVFTTLPVSSQQSTACNLNVSLINQDPYPVLPGNYVEVVFQVSGVDNTDCKGAKFELLEDYPFSL